MCSEKAELDDTSSGPHVGKDSDKGTCEELRWNYVMICDRKKQHS